MCQPPPRGRVVLIQNGNRDDAIRALINLWLKDKKLSCMYCSRNKYFEDCDTCHGKPLLATNKDILEQFNIEMQELRQTRANKFAENKGGHMRMAVSMPSSLYAFLDTAMQSMYGEKLINDKYDLNWFMKNFGKYFQVPEER